MSRRVPEAGHPFDVIFLRSTRKRVSYRSKLGLGKHRPARSHRQTVVEDLMQGCEIRCRGFFPLKEEILHELEWLARKLWFLGLDVYQEPHFTATVCLS